MKRRPFLWVLLGLAAVVATAWGADRYAALTADLAERDRLRGQTALLEQWIAALGPEIDAQRAAEEAARVLISRVTLIDHQGFVLGDSSQTMESLALMDNHSDRPEVAAARSGVTGDSRRQSDTTKVSYIYSARRMEHAGRVGFVRIAVRAPTGAAFRSAYITLIAGTVALAASLLLYGYARHRRVTLAADRIAHALETETLAELPQSTDSPEIARLSRSIRRVTAERDARGREVESARKVLTSAVEGLSEGLIFVDHSRRVRVANQAARRLLETDLDPIGNPISQTVRLPALLDAVERTLRGDTDAAIHFSHETTDQAFEVRVKPLVDPDAGGGRQALVLILDVTQLRVLESVRQGFIADISHDLRTPLTAIKAAVETILEDDRFRDEPFPKMISRNADSIEGLVEDLTDLSMIESGAVTLDLDRFDLTRLVGQTVEQLRPVAGETRIELSLPNELWIDADERRLRRVLVNLLDNAIKFGRPDGVIEIAGRREGRWVHLSVRDEGIGIPAADTERIFNRFHQVAADRSRQRPGHGLGLAIVKHLVRLHGGRIEVRSELGRGSTFSVDLPAAGNPDQGDA